MRFPRFLIVATAICCLYFAGSFDAEAAKWYNRSALTGGGANALDAVPGSGTDMDDTETKAFVVTDSRVYFYDLDLTSGATESSPNVIAPDTAAGTKRWILVNSFAQIISSDTTFYVATTGSDTTGNGTVGAPWATLGKAISYLNGYYWDVSSVDVAVRLAYGEYEESAGIFVNHPCASSLTIQGSDATATTLIAIAGTGNDGTRDYIDVAGDQTVAYPAGVAIEIPTGENVGVYTVYGSEYSESTRITLDQTLNDNAAGSGFYVQALAWSDDVVVTFIGAQGIIIADGASIKKIDGIKFVSDPVEGAFAAISVEKSGYVYMTDIFAEDFARGFYAATSSTIEGSALFSIGHTMGGIYLDSNSAFRGSAYACHGVSGVVANADYGFYAQNNSFVDCSACVSNGNQDGFRAGEGSTIIVDVARAYDNDEFGVYLSMVSKGLVFNPEMGGNGLSDYGYAYGSILFDDSSTKHALDELRAASTSGIAMKNYAGATVATVENAGQFYPNGGLRQPSVQVSVAGPSDAVNVAGADILMLASASNNVTVGGLVGGVVGDVLIVSKIGAANSVTIEHQEGAGNQDFFLSSGADETIGAGVKGGWIFVFGGTNWNEIEN